MGEGNLLTKATELIDGSATIQTQILEFQSQVTTSGFLRLWSPGPEVLVSPENLLEMQIQSHELAALEVELSTLYCSTPSGQCLDTLQCENHWLQSLK